MSAKKRFVEKNEKIKRLLRCCRFVVYAGLLGCTASTSALDLSRVWNDPLDVRPPVLDSGVVLSGDTDILPCSASGGIPSPLTLPHAIDLALCNNPQIRTAWASIKIQVGAVGEAKAGYFPTISATANQLQTRTSSADSMAPVNSQRGHTYNGSLNWRLLDFGGRAANNQLAEKLLSAAIAAHDAAIQKNMTAVVGAYFDAMIAHATIKARQQASEIAEKTLISTRKRESKGVAPASDVLQATTARAKAQLTEHRAEGELRKVLAVLVYALGVSPASQLVLPVADMDSRSFVLDELSQLISEVRATHPAIRAAKAQLEAAQAKETVVTSEGLPTLDLTGGYSQNGYPNQGLSNSRTKTVSVGILLTVPLFDGFSRTYKIRGAQAQIEQSKAQLAEAEGQVVNELVKAHADAYSSMLNLRSSEELAQAASAAISSSERRYAKGVADILELLSTQNAFADAQQERIRCLIEWRSAQLKLIGSTGVMGRNQVMQSSGLFK